MDLWAYDKDHHILTHTVLGLAVRSQKLVPLTLCDGSTAITVAHFIQFEGERSNRVGRAVAMRLSDGALLDVTFDYNGQVDSERPYALAREEHTQSFEGKGGEWT